MLIAKFLIVLSLAALICSCGRAGAPVYPGKAQQHAFILDPLVN